MPGPASDSPPDDAPRETGQLNYEAIAGALGWSWRGVSLPPWSKLTPGEQDAFRAGSHDVMQKGWVKATENRGRHIHRARDL